MKDSSDRGLARLIIGTCTEGPTPTGSASKSTARGASKSVAKRGSRNGSKGIYALSLSLDSGLVLADHTAMSNSNPVFLAKRGRMLVAAHEIAGKAKAAVYAAHDDGSIEHVSTIADKSGAGTCHVTLHPNGRWLYGANYESGTLSCWPMRLDGSLGPLYEVAWHEGSGPNKCRQKGPHVSSSCFIDGAGDDLLAVCDLGIDALVMYEAPAGEGLKPEPRGVVRLPAGFGPRMVAVRPHVPGVVAVIGELANAVMLCEIGAANSDPEAGFEAGSRELNAFDLPSCGGLRSQATHAQFSPCGRWLYVSVRGKNVIAVYELDENSQVVGQARYSCGGANPCHFSLSPRGRYLAVANKDSDAVVVFHTPKPEDAEMKELCRIAVPNPTCVI